VSKANLVDIPVIKEEISIYRNFFFSSLSSVNKNFSNKKRKRRTLLFWNASRKIENLFEKLY